MTLEEQIEEIVARKAAELQEPLLKRIAELERNQKQWLSTAEAMEQFCLSRTTLENLRRDKVIECSYEGTKPLYSRESLQAYRERKPGRTKYTPLQIAS